MRTLLILATLLLAGCLRALPEDALPDAGQSPDSGVTQTYEERYFAPSPLRDSAVAVAQSGSNQVYLATSNQLVGRIYAGAPFSATDLAGSPAGSAVTGLTANSSYGYALAQTAPAASASWQLLQLQGTSPSTVKASIAAFSPPAVAALSSDNYFAAAEGRLIAWNSYTRIDYGGAAPWTQPRAVFPAPGGGARVLAVDSSTRQVTLYRVQPGPAPAIQSQAALRTQSGALADAFTCASEDPSLKVMGFTGAPGQSSFFFGDETAGASVAADPAEQSARCIGALSGGVFLFPDHVVVRKTDGTFVRRSYGQFVASAATNGIVGGLLGGVSGATFLSPAH
jgi:hypothetical protein